MMRTTADDCDMDAQVDQAIKQGQIGGQSLCSLRVTNNWGKRAVEIGGKQKLAGKHVAKFRQSRMEIAAARRSRARRCPVDADQGWMQDGINSPVFMVLTRTPLFEMTQASPGWEAFLNAG